MARWLEILPKSKNVTLTKSQVFMLFFYTAKRDLRVELRLLVLIMSMRIKIILPQGDAKRSLFIDFYRPSQEAKAARQEELARKKAGVDARKPAEVLNYLTQLITQDQRPQLVVLSGNRLNMRFRQGVEQLGLFWLGVSDNRRVYVQMGKIKVQKPNS